MIRRATVDDVDELVRLRGVMFDALDTVDDGAWREPATAWFREALREPDRIVAFVADAWIGGRGGLAACGVAEFIPGIPALGNPTGTYAHLSSVATDPDHRRCGLAKEIATELVAECRRRGSRRVELNATPEAEAIYRALGFVDRTGGRDMHLPPASSAERHRG